MEQGMAPNSIPRLVSGTNGATFVAGQLVYHELDETLTERWKAACLVGVKSERQILWRTPLLLFSVCIVYKTSVEAIDACKLLADP